MTGTDSIGNEHALTRKESKDEGANGNNRGRAA